MLLASWIENIFTPLSDLSFYFVLAVTGTLLFTIRLALMMFGIDGAGDFDTDMDADGMGGLEAHGDFSLFSMFSILSFMMGAGWLGLAARLDWGLGPVPAAIYAGLFGFGLMFMSSFAIFQMRKLTQTSRYDPKSAIGKTGSVYMRIPASGSGRGQVQLSGGGRRRTVEAITQGAEIESFVTVKIVDVRDDGVLVVERV